MGVLVLLIVSYIRRVLRRFNKHLPTCQLFLLPRLRPKTCPNGLKNRG